MKKTSKATRAMKLTVKVLAVFLLFAFVAYINYTVDPGNIFRSVSAESTELPAEWIEQAAKTYFGLENFSYTEDEDFYNEQTNSYLVDHEREDPANAEVISCELEGDTATVTAKLYRDPLRLPPKATISYQLQKK